MSFVNIIRIYRSASLPNSNILLALFLGSCFILSLLELIGLASVGALLVQILGGSETINFFFIEFSSLVSAAAFILSIWLFRCAVAYCLNRYNHSFIQKIKSGIQERQFDVAFSSRERSDQMEAGRLFTALTNEVQMITGQVFIPVSMAMAEGMLVILFTFFALFIMPLGILLAVGIVLLGYLITSKLINPISKRLGQKRLEAEKNWSEKIVNMFSLRREAEVYGVINPIKSDLIKQVTNSNVLTGRFYSIAPLNRAVLETFGVFAIIALMIFAQWSNAPNEHIMFVILALVRMLPSATRILAAVQSYRFAAPVIDKQLAYFHSTSVCTNEKGVDPNSAKNIRLDGSRLIYQFDQDIDPNTISFSLGSNGLVVISGESGLGKTTMLDNLVDFLLTKQCSVKSSAFPVGVSYASQNNLVIEANIQRNLEFYRDIGEELTLSGAELLKRWGFSAEHFGLERRVTDFSGGEKKRVTVARALNCSKGIIVMDEPTSGLDRIVADKIIKSIKEKARDCLVVVATHDNQLIDCADIVFSLKRAVRNGCIEPGVSSI